MINLPMQGFSFISTSFISTSFISTSLISTGLLVGAIALSPTAVQAATFSSGFTVNVTTGPLVGTTGSGSLSVDTSTLSGSGLESLGVAQGLIVNFSFLGNIFTQTDDNMFPTFPTVTFQNGQLLGLNYGAPNGYPYFFIGASTSPDFGSGGGAFSYFPTESSVADLVGVSTGTVTYSSEAVPEPSEIGGAFVGLGFLWLGNRRLASRRQIKSFSPIKNSEQQTSV